MSIEAALARLALARREARERSDLECILIFFLKGKVSLRLSIVRLYTSTGFNDEVIIYSC